MSENTAPEMTIEETFSAIEAAIRHLEDEDISLEDSFEEYKKGIELIEQCSRRIDMVEKKVLKLSENGETDEFE